MARRMMVTALMAGTVGSCGVDQSVPEITIKESVVTARRTLAERVETMEDTLGFFATTDLLPHPSGYIVVDGGNDRLIVLNRDLDPEQVIATSGSGPGELEGPLSADWLGDEIAIVEIGNRRISFLGLDGSFRRTLPLPGRVGDLAYQPSGSVLIASGPPDSFLMRLDKDGTSQAWARRPTPRVEDPEYPGGLGRQDKVAVTEGGMVWVLDNTAGQLFSFDSEGRLLRSVMLPQRLMDPIRESNAAFAADLATQGRRVVGSSLVKTMKTQQDGSLLLLFTSPPFFGLLVNTDDLEATLLAVPDGPGRWDPLLNASGGVLEGDEITVLHSYGLTRYQLSEVP